jgi:filamentous hemagglutinin family protein
MTQTTTPVRLGARKALMMSCATVALAATALLPQKAVAQAFVGTPTTQSGTVTYSRATPGTESIVLGTSTATINWTPTNQQPGGGPINFLPAGNTATFTSNRGIADYTVLNRIVPASRQAIALNGTVISTLQETNTTGGHVWFFAPGGIVVGATAVFNVGGLLLTTNNPSTFDASPNGFTATFRGEPAGTSSIKIANGAQINALQQNSYVALIAPRIEQGGKVRVNGSAAYVAATRLSMTMNQGLFDIQVDLGTPDANGVVHTGETSGPANATGGDNHNIYMVAVPKNQALTMLLGGKVGFDDAVSAQVKNGQILLSSGWGVEDSDGSARATGNGGLNSSIAIGPGDFTSDVVGRAQGLVSATADTGDLTFDGKLDLSSSQGSGGNAVSLVASNGHKLTVHGDLNLASSALPGNYPAVSILADSGASVTIDGSSNLSATAGGGSPASSQSPAADAYGGTIALSASNGATISTGDLNLDVSAQGQANSEGRGGSAYGGNLWLGADNGGRLAVNGDLTGRANGTGGNAAGQAGSGIGGSIHLSANGDGSLKIDGTTDLQASGSGGVGPSPGGGSGGSIGLFAHDGSISSDALILAANGTNVGGTLDLESNGHAGSLQFGSVDAFANGGDNGGQIFVASGSGGTVDLGDAALQASGAFGGLISLSAGSCALCGGGEDFAAQAALLPAGGGIAATNLSMNTPGDILINLSDGADVSVSKNIIGSAGQAISLTDDGTGGAIRAHSIDLTSITLDDSAKIFADLIKFTTASDMTVGNLSATSSITLTAGGLATFNGTASSPTITVTSSDIDIASGASLGAAGITNLLTLNALGNGQPIILGDGPSAPGQYHLDEDGDIRATSVVFNALNGADIQVFDADIDGSTTPGGGVTNLTLNTSGVVLVNGLVNWINAGASDALTINAGNLIRINTDTGGIQMTNSAGTLAGILSLTANNVWVGNGALLDQLAANVNFAGRDTALGTNSGTPNQQGFVRAGTIVANVANSFLVQNSGTPQLFAGIDTGPGGLTLNNTGTTPAILIVYGRQTNGNGVLITNEDFLGSVNVGGTGGFTDDSSVNGCEIGSATSCNAPIFAFDNSSILGPLKDDDKKKDQEGDEGDTRVDPSLRLINTTPINLDHTISEPVTSGGDVVVGGGPVQPN